MNIRERDYLLDFKKKYVEGCPICFGKNLKCTCQEKLQLEIKKIKANIPLKYCDFTNFTLKKADLLNYVSHLKENLQTGQGLYLYGGVGSESIKSVAYILTKALEQNYTAEFIQFGDCIALSTKSWYSEDVYFQGVVNLLDANFLVMDDVGSEYKKELATAVFDGIFRERCHRLNATLMISHVNWDEVGTYYGNKVKGLFEEHMKPILLPGVQIRNGN